MTVIATCCPYGNLEKIVKILQRAGLNLNNHAFVEFHDKVFGPSGKVDPLEIDQQSLQGLEIDDRIVKTLLEVGESPFLMADCRCLWLLDSWASRLPEAKFLLFYTHVDSALAYACRHGIEPQRAIDSWQLASSQMLKFQRYNRRRTLLLDADVAIRQPQDLVEVCSHIGISLQSPPLHAVPVPDRADLARYLAQVFVSNQPELQAMEAQLEASAQPFGEESPLELHPLDLFNQHSHWLVDHRNALQELNETVKSLQIAEDSFNEQNLQLLKLQAENDQLNRANNNQVELNVEQQSELENLQQVNKELEAAAKEVSLNNEDFLKKLQQVQQEHQTLNATTRGIAQENELLLLQFHQVQEELKQTYLQRQELEQQAQKDQTTQQQFQAQVDQLTKPVISRRS